MSPDSFAASVCASIFCLYSAVNLRRLARAITSGFGRGTARPPVMSPNTESNIPVACIAGRAEPFIVAMLSLFPALLAVTQDVSVMLAQRAMGSLEPSPESPDSLLCPSVQLRGDDGRGGHQNTSFSAPCKIRG